MRGRSGHVHRRLDLRERIASLMGQVPVNLKLVVEGSEETTGALEGFVPGHADPDAELILMGVEEPQARIHAPNESVDPAEIAAMALTEALFLQRYAAIRR